jgi:hypothetical protein
MLSAFLLATISVLILATGTYQGRTEVRSA